MKEAKDIQTEFVSDASFKSFFLRTSLKNIRTIKIKAPIFAQFEITSLCNQKCRFCYNVWKTNQYDSEDLTFLEKLQVIEKLKELEIFGLILSGGEPLTVKNIEEIITQSNNSNIDTTIITNGILLSNKKCESLKEAGLKGMQISLHSPYSKIHDSITNKNGSFQKTVNGIKSAIKVFDPDSININMVVTQPTHSHVFEMGKFLKKIGVLHFSISSYSYSGLGHKNNELQPNSRHFNISFVQLLKAKKELGISTLVSGSFPLCILDTDIDQEIIGQIGNICDAGITQIVVGPSGQVRPCVSYQESIGHILFDDIKEQWINHPFLLGLRRMDNVPPQCRDCEFVLNCCGGCRASAKEYGGQIDALHPLLEKTND